MPELSLSPSLILAAIVVLVTAPFAIRWWRRERGQQRFEDLLASGNANHTERERAWTLVSERFRLEQPWLDPSLPDEARRDLETLYRERHRRDSWVYADYQVKRAVDDYRTRGIPFSESLRRARRNWRLDDAKEMFPPTVGLDTSGQIEIAEYEREGAEADERRAR